MRGLFSGSSPEEFGSRSRSSYLYFQDPFVGSFSNHFLQAKASQNAAKSYKINLEDFVEDETFTFFVHDTPNIKLRRVRRRDGPANETYTMKFITIRDEISLQMHLKEAEILCQLEHKHIVRSFGYGEKTQGSAKVLGILMEFFENSLQKRITECISKQKFFPKEQISLIVTALISGVLYLQFKRIFHANIKPENILMSSSGEIRISNFSSSQDFSNERSTITNNLADTNQNNNASLYWSPEYRRAFLESKPSVNFNVFKVDSFALGLLIAHLVSLAPIETLYKILESSENSPEKQSLYKHIETRYDKGFVDLIRDLSNFDEDERKTVVSLCFAPKKTYEKLVCKEISQFYNLVRTDRSLYKSVRVLGSGGFGEVHEVKNSKTNERFAEKSVKFIDSRCLIDSMEEVLINASMDHENIVKFFFYDIEEVETRNDFYNLYCYIELMDRALDSEIKHRSKTVPKSYFSREDVENLLFCMAKAMKYMQEVRNTSHSDIKPQNILISSDSKTYKICDFGIARPNLPKSQVTTNMTMKGSPLYLAPELREYDSLCVRVRYNPFKSDIFSLGLSILHMLTLESFKRDKAQEKEDCLAFFLPKEVQFAISQRYGPDFVELLKEMLVYDFKDRLDYLGFYQKVYSRWRSAQRVKNSEKYALIKKKLNEIPAKESKNPTNFTSQIALLQESLEIYEEIGDYESMAITMTTLGNLYKELGLVEQAQGFYEKSLELGCRTLGYEHPRIAIMLNNLGVIYTEFGAFQRANTYFLQAVDIQTKNFGAEDAKIVTFLVNLASLYLKQGDYEHAVEVYTKALKLAYKTFESESLDIALILNNLGSAYRRFGRKEKFELSLGFYQEALALYRKKQPLAAKYQRNYAELLQNLSKVLRDLRRIQESKQFLEESLKIYVELYGVYHKLVGFSYDTLATLHKKLGDLPKALENQRKAVEILESLASKQQQDSKSPAHSRKSPVNNGKKHNSFLLELPKVAGFSTTVSSPSNSPTKKSKKWSFFESAQDFLHINSDRSEKSSETGNLPVKSLCLVGVLNNLGIIYRDLKEFEKARENFQKAWNILRVNRNSEDEIKTVEVLNNLASCLIELGNDLQRLTRAKEMLEEGLAVAGKRKEKRMKENEEIMAHNLAIVNRKLKTFAKK